MELCTEIEMRILFFVDDEVDEMKRFFSTPFGYIHMFWYIDIELGNKILKDNNGVKQKSEIDWVTTQESDNVEYWMGMLMNFSLDIEILCLDYIDVDCQKEDKKQKKNCLVFF